MTSHCSLLIRGQVTRLLVCGSRKWLDEQAVYDALDAWLEGYTGRWSELTIVEGECTVWDSEDHRRKDTPDTWARKWAESYGFKVDPFPADWSQGKGAGFRRNQQMLDSQVDEVVAFWVHGSNGTQDMIKRATQKGVPVQVVHQ